MTTERKRPEIEMEQALELGLNSADWKGILNLLGRAPTEHEAIVFHEVWSEHFSGIHSRNLSRFFQTASTVLPYASGLRPAAYPLGDGRSVYLACNSHPQMARKHPRLGMQACIDRALLSLYSLGAVPQICNLAIRVGPLSNVENQNLFRTFISSASSYLTPLGIPVPQIDIFFHNRFKYGLAINVFAYGLGPSALLTPEVNKQEEHLVLYVGTATEPIKRRVKVANTLRDDLLDLGIANFNTTYRLGMAVAECLRNGQALACSAVDEGGIILSLFGLAERTGLAFHIDLDRVPLQYPDIPPAEIMRSHSPGRVLMLVNREQYKEIHAVFDKWKLKVVVLGSSTDEHGMKISWRHSELVDIPIRRCLESTSLREYQMLFNPPTIKVNPRHKVAKSDIQIVGELASAGEDKEYSDEEGPDGAEALPVDLEDSSEIATGELEPPAYLGDTWTDLLGSVSFAEKRKLTNSFDFTAGLKVFSGIRDSVAWRLPLADDLPEKIVVSSLTSKVLFMQNDTYLGAAHSVAEAMRNLACLGVKPQTAYACFNFGNPRKYKELCDISEILRGAGDACRCWGVEVATQDLDLTMARGAIPSLATMSIVLMGQAKERAHILPISFQQPKDAVLVLGDTRCDIAVSEYAYYCHHVTKGKIPDLDYDHESNICDFVRELVQSGLLKSCASVNAGGLAIALARCCLSASPPRGLKIELSCHMSSREFREDALLFAETPGRFVVSCAPEHAVEIERRMRARGIILGGIGEVGGREISLSGLVTESVSLSTAYKVWTQGESAIFGEE